MPKRRAAAVNSEESASGDSPAKKTKPEAKKPARGRGRPPLSAEEKAKRAALKEAKSNSGRGRGRGRPKGSTFPRQWLAYSPWIRKPLAFSQSSPTPLKSPSVDQPSKDNDDDDNGSGDDDKRSGDVSSLHYASDSGHSDDNSEVSSVSADKQPIDTNPNTHTSPLSSPSAVTKYFSISNSDVSRKPKNNKMRKGSKDSARQSKSLSEEELEVLRLEKDKLRIEIEVLHLKKKKLILQLEQMAHSPAPFN